MNNKKLKIAVVGGGTAGFVSALILKRTYPSLEIDVIRFTKCT
jgi:protoporphyrinogen oxidase